MVSTNAMKRKHASSDSMEHPSAFKVALCGASKVGKTTWIKKMFFPGEFEEDWNHTPGVTAWPISIRTTKNQTIQFKMVEVGGYNKSLWGNDYLKDFQAGIIMFDVTTEFSYRQVKHQYENMMRSNGRNNEGNAKIPIILCGNKVYGDKVYGDMKRELIIKPKDIAFLREKDIKYCEIWAKSGYNFYPPLELIAQQLTGDPSLKIEYPDWPIAKTDDSSRENTETKESNGDEKDDNLFLLCTHCTRMIYVEMLSGPGVHYSLATTTCRTCRKLLHEQGESGSGPLENKSSPDLIRSTRLYECCTRIAGGDVELLLENKNNKPGSKKMVLFTFTEDVLAEINTSDRIYSVRTESDVLRDLENLTRDELLLPYVLGGFF